MELNDDSKEGSPGRNFALVVPHFIDELVSQLGLAVAPNPRHISEQMITILFI